MSKKRGLEDPPGSTLAAVSLPRQRKKGVVHTIITLVFCLCFTVVIHSLFVLEPLARASVQEPETNNDAPIDLPGLNEQSTISTAHSSLISSLSSHKNTSGSGGVSTITTDTTKRITFYIYDDLFTIRNIPNLTKTLTSKPSRYTDGLEFIHITKTAGSSIEAAAANAGIIYGACHWLKLQRFGFGSGCDKPDKASGLELNRTRVYQWKRRKAYPDPEYWHTPPHWFRDDHNPYQNKSFFAVVRNPYERLVSEFFWSCESDRYPGLCDDTTSATMNWFIRKQSKTCLREKCRGHFLPQHLYIYDLAGKQVIDHILRFEHLNEDFSALMTLYDLPIGIPGKKNVRNETGNTGVSGSMNVANLTKKTIEVINEVYAGDFALFNYSKVASPDEFLSSSYGNG